MTAEPTNTVSINVMIARGLAAAVTVAGYLMIYPVFKLYEEMVDARQQQIDSHVLSISHNISDALQYISQASLQISSSRKVKDMTLLGDVQEVEAWSVATRKLFTDSVGLGILSSKGEYLGNKDTLQIDKLCITDTALYLKDKLRNFPPIHTLNPELKHFDVFNKITDDEGNVSGLLLMSFHVSRLQGVLDRYAEDGYSYELKNSKGILIASYGSGKHSYLTTVNLPDSDWELGVSADDKLSKENWRLIQFGVATVIIVSLLFVLVAWLYVYRRLISDIDRVKLLLSYRFLDDKDKPSTGSEIQLSEIAELLSDIDQLAEDVSESRSQLELQACTDKLTGLLNRRGFEEDRAKLYRMAGRQSVTLVLLDIDYFKKVNDTYGHAVGDKVLSVLGAELKSSVRSTDKIYRIGGDEVLVVFAADNLANLQQWYEDLSERFSDELTAMEGYTTSGPGFTLSAGATAVDHEYDESLNESMVRADKALYEAKDGGRAKLVIV